MTIRIYNSDGKYLTAINDYSELKAAVSSAESLITEKRYYLVELDRQSGEKAGKIYFCGLYRSKEKATDELLRLWHVKDKYPGYDNFDFKFAKDKPEVKGLEIIRTRTAFI